jgi:hypothetical protein
MAIGPPHSTILRLAFLNTGGWTEMTLILTIANERGVHQSSDYQLTDERTGYPITDKAGTKQLDAMIPPGMSVRLAFTGVARFILRGQTVSTREWLQAELQVLPPRSDLQTICRVLAKRCAEQMKPLMSKELTLVLAVAEIGRPFRVAVISNARTKKQFETQVRTVKNPFHLIAGYRDAVPEVERHRLKALARDLNKSPEEIRKALAGINAIAAGASKGWISQECWVGSQFEDGTLRRVQTHGLGGVVEGSVPHLVGGLDMLQWVKENFRTAPGQNIQLVQSAAVMAGPGGATPLPPPEGEPRTFKLSGGSVESALRSPVGTHFASLKMSVLTGGITARRNEEATGPFAAVELRRVSTCEDFARPLLPWPQAKAPLFVDDAEVPRGWEQTFGYWVAEGIERVSIPRGSRGVRNLAFLADNEELIIVVNENELVLKPDEERAVATLTAAVQWRTRMDGTRG